jgi:hypothetical protein
VLDFPLIHARTHGKPWAPIGRKSSCTYNIQKGVDQHPFLILRYEVLKVCHISIRGNNLEQLPAVAAVREAGPSNVMFQGFLQEAKERYGCGTPNNNFFFILQNVSEY